MLWTSPPLTLNQLFKQKTVRVAPTDTVNADGNLLVRIIKIYTVSHGKYFIPININMIKLEKTLDFSLHFL